MFLFLPMTYSYELEMDIDQTIWQADPGLLPDTLKAQVKFIGDSSVLDSFQIELTNQSSLTVPVSGYDFPATVLLTGVAFNLPVDPINIDIVSGFIDTGTYIQNGGDANPSPHWGFQNDPNKGYYQEPPDGVTTLSVNTVLSTMQAASSDGRLSDGNVGNMNGPDYGILSDAYVNEINSSSPTITMPSNYPYFERHALFTIILDDDNDSLTPFAISTDWENLFKDIDAQHLVVGFGSPTAVVPEPATMLLFGSGLIGLAGLRRRMKKRSQ
jgi:hypothetical protein